MKKLFICAAVFIAMLVIVDYYNQVISISNLESDCIQVRRYELKPLCKDTVLFNGVRCLIVQ